MPLQLKPATAEEAEEIAALRNAVAVHLTARHGKGAWSGNGTARGVLWDMKRGKVYVAKRRGRAIATLTLSTRKPWAIDRTYFSPGGAALYLTAMAVAPAQQRTGVGRACVEQIMKLAREWPADWLRLDAFAAEAGAGGFYRKCGFTLVGRKSYRGIPLVYFEARTAR